MSPAAHHLTYSEAIGHGIKEYQKQKLSSDSCFLIMKEDSVCVWGGGRAG